MATFPIMSGDLVATVNGPFSVFQRSNHDLNPFSRVSFSEECHTAVATAEGFLVVTCGPETRAIFPPGQWARVDATR